MLLPRLKPKLFTYSLDEAESSGSLVLGFPRCRYGRWGSP